MEGDETVISKLNAGEQSKMLEIFLQGIEKLKPNPNNNNNNKNK